MTNLPPESKTDNSLFATSPAAGAGFLQGMGMAFVISGILMQFPKERAERLMDILFPLGCAALAFGTYKFWRNYQDWKQRHGNSAR